MIIFKRLNAFTTYGDTLRGDDVSLPATSSVRAGERRHLLRIINGLINDFECWLAF